MSGSVLGSSSQSDVAAARDELLRPWPRIGIGAIALAAVVLAIYTWGVEGTDARPGELIGGIPNIVDLFVRMFPPEIEMQHVTLAVSRALVATESITFSFPTVITAIVETVQMAIIGTTLSVFLALPFGLLAARNTTPHLIVYQATRLVLNANRAVPELIYALIFVAAVGLGPFSGVLALALSSIGFMAKMYAEAIEAIDPQQLLGARVKFCGNCW